MIPSYTQDNLYPAYQDRLLTKSLGAQAGVVEENDFKVTAGTGLQVAVESGKGFVAQTNANQEAGTFYNGLYNILNPTKQNPYNTVEVPTTNPQIAQIILRVYDVAELGIGGASYGRIEWLNGTANAGATAAHVEEGKASEFGAAVLPTSSFRCAYIIVPKNATTSSEYSIIDARTTSYFMSGGLINNAGTTLNGSPDFKSQKLGTGLYEIRWKMPRTSANYSVVATAHEGAIPLYLAEVRERTSSLFKVVIQNTTEAKAVNSSFSFIAFIF